jgi:LysM repeat protein
MNKIYLFIVLFVSFHIKAEIFLVHDSVGIEKKDGKVFILHKVEPKETFYSISKRYAVTVDDIKKYNQEAAAGLKIGQTIMVPTKVKMASVQKEETRKNSPESRGPKTHNVVPKETLFSISKKYNVSIDELKNANPEIASGLKIGQVITIPGKGSKEGYAGQMVKEDKKTEDKKQAEKEKKDKKSEEKVEKKEEKKEKNTEEKKEEKKKEEKVTEVKEKEKEIKKKDKDKEDISGLQISSITTTVGGYTKISETGMGELMENGDTQKYLAFHKTAPVGTIIQVVNQANNQKIFVKVIGPIPNGTNANVVIQMTAKAFERLATSSSEKQIKTEISYIKD